nr:hypothetical protein CFP56_11327 [Quercus suber]
MGRSGREIGWRDCKMHVVMLILELAPHSASSYRSGSGLKTLGRRRWMEHFSGSSSGVGTMKDEREGAVSERGEDDRLSEGVAYCTGCTVDR